MRSDMRIEKGLFDGHVLQRRIGGARAAISGSCAAEGPVIATVRGEGGVLPQYHERAIGRADGGRFHGVLNRLPAGGPYAVTLACGCEKVLVRDVFVGDLWLLAGQSNMEGCAIIERVPEPHPQVRCFTMGRRWKMACDPLHLRDESPDFVHGGNGIAAADRLPRRAKRGGGLGVHFGRLMHAYTGVPQGVIATAQGGSSLQQWSPDLRDLGGHSLYGSMWLSLQAVGQPLAGVLWSQGESESLPHLSRAYTPHMCGLVNSLRRDLEQPKLPWLIVQTGRFIKGETYSESAWPDPTSWNLIQEQQRLLPKVVSCCAIVPSVDLELDDLVHLGSDALSILASRLANVATHLVFGDKSAGREISPAEIRFHKASRPYGPQITVDFDGVAGGLHSAGPVRGFTLIQANGNPVACIHRVTLDGSRVLIHLIGMPSPGSKLIYGYGLDPFCNLEDDRGMAVPVFGPLPISKLAGSRPRRNVLALGDLPAHPGCDLRFLEK